MHPGDLVSMARLKELVRSKPGKDGTFRALILSEPDQIQKEDFIVKVGVWLRVLDEELRSVGRTQLWCSSGFPTQ